MEGLSLAIKRAMTMKGQKLERDDFKILFTLIMEGLSLAIKRAMTMKRQKLERDDFKMTYFAFWLTMWFLWLNEKFQVSPLIWRGVQQEETHAMAQMLGCKPDKFPSIFLRIPIGKNMSRCRFWDPLIENFKRNCLHGSARALWVKVINNIHGRNGNLKNLESIKILGNIWKRFILNKGYSTMWIRKKIISRTRITKLPNAERLSVRDILKDFGVNFQDAMCPCCERESETARHIFLKCDLAIAMWIESSQKSHLLRNISKVAILVMLKAIWDYRNDKDLFQNKTKSPHSSFIFFIVDYVVLNLLQWIENAKEKTRHSRMQRKCNK
ncbi:hypothetical protein LXL04_019021 [Taraxacum kok-saghyz]